MPARWGQGSAKRSPRRCGRAQWKVIQHVREKFTCRTCEKISQAPAPFHVSARGHGGPSLLAMILHAKFALHQPLNRQSETYAREGIDLPLSTLADHVGACAAVLAPLVELIRAHVKAAERVHGDDTPVALLAKGKTIQARLWTYVRDDRPFGGADPPAAFYAFSRDRKGEHLESYAGILQADAYAGFNALYKTERRPGPITEAACWSHARRKFFVLADVTSRARARKPVIVAPLALEAVPSVRCDLRGGASPQWFATGPSASRPHGKDWPAALPPTFTGHGARQTQAGSTDTIKGLIGIRPVQVIRSEMADSTVRSMLSRPRAVIAPRAI